MQFFSSEKEEQTRQKLQLERVQLEGKKKNLEDTVLTLQNDLIKVKIYNRVDMIDERIFYFI